MDTLEATPIISTENTYQSNAFMSAAKSPEFFRQQMPPIIRQIATGEPIARDSQQATALQQEIYEESQRIWNEGSNNLSRWVYADYASDHNLTTARPANDLLPQRQDIKRLDELTDEERSDWNTYLNTVDFPRDKAIKAIRQNLHITLPSGRYINDEVVQGLLLRFSSAPYAVILKFFPDITDDEAKRFFGQLSSAEEVRRLSVDPATTS